MKYALLLAAAAALTATPVNAQRFDAGKLYAAGYAIKHIEPATAGTTRMALELLQASAAKGNGEAMVQLGEMVLSGRAPIARGRDRVAEAVRWWEKSWQYGATRGYHDIALLHFGAEVPGTGGAGANALPRDDAAAFHLFKLAADKGDSKARRYVGICYEHGRGVTRDYAMAATYYDPGSFYYANLLMDGRGVARDVPRALAIYRENAAHERGGAEDQYAAETLARLYAEGKVVHADPAQALAYEKLAAQYGSTEAYSRLSGHAEALYDEALPLLRREHYAQGIPMLIEAARLGSARARALTDELPK
ncbi:tetratricopeptide repeat protein [Novosphingobium resinovorum]|uniref:tetratricopeptide repeat protein n=1 Tax=Novosphingobium resinovorum TaxID=158500 RepID=UPI002ED37AB5|nr:tetratricopeptide repeat protein [Novosphingobium resinovorum]